MSSKDMHQLAGTRLTMANYGMKGTIRNEHEFSPSHAFLHKWKAQFRMQSSAARYSS